MKHPSGASGSFTTDVLQHPRGGVQKTCWGSSQQYADSPRYYASISLLSKTLSGPGLPTMTWNYSYSAPDGAGSYYDCTNCPHTRWTRIAKPDGTATVFTYGIWEGENEGQLLQTDEQDSAGNLLRSTAQHFRAYNAGPYPASFGDSIVRFGNSLTPGRLFPLDQRTVTQQSTSFSWAATAFDGRGRPTSVTLSGPGGQRVDTTTYSDAEAAWVLGQVDTVVSNGYTVVDNDYDTLGRLTAHREFGILKFTQAYNADGTLYSRTDGANNTTTFTNYKLGIPQTVSHPLGITESATVDSLGRVTSITDAASFTTGFGYDAMSRLASITPPGGFTATGISFGPAVAAYGLPAGHWRQTITRGAAVTQIDYDAFWRPVMTRTYDSGGEAGTRKVSVKQYDFDGRPTYESYPARDIATVGTTAAGTRTTYDAVGRVVLVQQDSELGLLSTSTSYLAGFQTQTTNPRNKTTTQTFWALDDPAKAQLAGISAPAGVSVSIARDAFGKPTAITRGGSFAGYTSSVTRRYVYDAGQRLCKTLEPEVGATVQTYDAAGNVTWKAPGQNLPNTAACDDTSVAASAKLTYGYDALNRLTSVTYGDGSPSVTRTYTADGLLQTIASNGSTWTYGYNALRKLASETLNYGGQNYGISWGYNAQGDL
ncbi:hypothetical protein LXT12_16825, partial [Pelomonas sp. P7]